MIGKKSLIGIEGIIVTLSLVSVILLSGCVENEKTGLTGLPEKNITNLTPENLKAEIINTIDSIKFYQYNISAEEKYTINAQDYYYKWIVSGYSDKENKISIFDYTHRDEYGSVFEGVKSYNIKDTLYFSHNVGMHKTCRGGWFSSCETEHRKSLPYTTQLSENWAREDEMAVPFKIFDSLSAIREILKNSDIEILSEDEKNYEINIKPNEDGMKILIQHIQITDAMGETFPDGFENACNNLIKGMENLTLTIYVDKKTLAINKIYATGIFKGVYGKSTLVDEENIAEFNKKINIEIPKEVEDDAKKR